VLSVRGDTIVVDKSNGVEYSSSGRKMNGGDSGADGDERRRSPVCLGEQCTALMCP
jgi:hypothetical protein